MGFDAFISYSHAADGRLALALQRGMQRMAKLWYSMRALRIFRDESALSVNPQPWASIQAALDDSRWFIFLVSPQFASSEWVNREVGYWLVNRSTDRLLVVVTAGEWRWDDRHLVGDAVLDALLVAMDDEPRHIDLRWAHSETDLDFHNASFRDAVADLCAPFHGVAKDDLESEDVRLYRRGRRVARATALTMAILLVLSVAFGVEAVRERDDANRQTLNAKVQEAVAEEQALATTQPDKSLLLVSAAVHLDNNPETQSALIDAVDESSHLIRMVRFPGAVKTGALSLDGQQMAIVNDRGILAISSPKKTRGRRYACSWSMADGSLGFSSVRMIENSPLSVRTAPF